MGFPHSSVGKESTCNAGDPGLIPGSGRSPGEGNSNTYSIPLQYSCPESPIDRGAWQVHGVTRVRHDLATKPHITTYRIKGFPGSSNGKEICLQSGRPGFNPWVRKTHWRRAWKPTLVFLPGESMDRGVSWATVHGVTKSRTEGPTHTHYWSSPLLWSSRSYPPPSPTTSSDEPTWRLLLSMVNCYPNW